MALTRTISPWVATAQSQQTTFRPDTRFWEMSDVRVRTNTGGAGYVEVATSEYSVAWATSAPTSQAALVVVTFGAGLAAGVQVEVVIYR